MYAEDKSVKQNNILIVHQNSILFIMNRGTCETSAWMQFHLTKKDPRRDIRKNMPVAAKLIMGIGNPIITATNDIR